MTKRITAGALGLALLAPSRRPASGAKADYPAAPVPFTDVHLTDAFWAPRLETNRTVTIPHLQEERGDRPDQELRPGRGGSRRGHGRQVLQRYPFNDSDVYKIIEAASYALATHPDPELERYVDGLIAKIAAAQEPDGYLYAARTIGGPPPQPWVGKERWSHLYMSHELYNARASLRGGRGPLPGDGEEEPPGRRRQERRPRRPRVRARASGPIPPATRRSRSAWSSSTGSPGRASTSTWPSSSSTPAAGPKAASRSSSRDGKEQLLYGEYAQDHKPFVEQTEAVGHAVRAGYLYAGAADVAALTGDAAYIAALEKIWADMAGTKLYITGGIGAAGGWEGYGPPYRLPNLSAYAETCANIATFLWNSRMQRLTLDAKYADVMERILYNGVLSGISLSGDRFFYPNPLASFGQHERVPWFGCACCPPNVARILTSVPGYFYAASRDEVYVNLYAQGTGKMKVAGTDLELIQTTEYPWKCDIKIEVKPASEAEFTLALRIPGWALNSPVPTDLYTYMDRLPGTTGPTLKVNGEDVQVPRELNKGYALIKRTWKAGDVVELSMPMPVRRVVANDAVEADRGRVAVERGPLVYCAEWTDNDGRVANLVLPDGAALAAETRPDLLGGVVVITGEGRGGEREGREDRQREEAPDPHPVLRLGQPGQGRDGRLAGPRCLQKRASPASPASRPRPRSRPPRAPSIPKGPTTCSSPKARTTRRATCTGGRRRARPSGSTTPSRRRCGSPRLRFIGSMTRAAAVAAFRPPGASSTSRGRSGSRSRPPARTASPRTPGTRSRSHPSARRPSASRSNSRTDWSAGVHEWKIK